MAPKGILLVESVRMWPSFTNHLRIAIARARVVGKDKDISLELLIEYAVKNKLESLKGWIERYIAEILLNFGEGYMGEAEDWIKRAIQTNERNGTLWNLGRCYALYTGFYMRKGDLFRAKENLGKAIEVMRDCGGDGWVEKYERELALLS